MYYSLYRSWLTRDPLARDPLSRPDIVVNVGEGASGVQQFPAHRAVLTANSGYFMAALSTLEPSCACVSVSNVSAEAFAPLHAYMYTGYLDISLDNIYGVLLATHYLHMPRALDLCWEFLRTHQPVQPVPQPQPPVLVKPIPSRNKLVGGPPWRPPWRPPHMILPVAEHSPFRSPEGARSLMAPPVEIQTTQEGTAHDKASPSTELISEQPPSEQHDSDAKQHPKQSPDRASSPLIVPKPALSPTSSKSSASGKVVIDVACCDGPVRFHRVLNTSYGNADDDTSDPPDENHVDQSDPVPGAAQLRRARLNKLQGESTDTSEYTCLYCNHTFKSHYCYQKHARRHLNPLTHKQNVPERSAPNARQPARPLDMNVQYYPCKTCGSKFPSYYFVHKHRKLCHAGEDNENSVGVTNETTTT